MSDSFSPFGNDLFGEPIKQVNNSPIAIRFLVPPFSVLNSREGDWQSRKKAWIDMGIKSEMGRDTEGAVGSLLEEMNKYDKESGKRGEREEYKTSIFDPVLCEIIYRWFCQENCQIVDPFAGGSVRGIVASCMNLNYWGSELRQEQIDSNLEQVKRLCQNHIPEYICGDSLETLNNAPDCDFVFSCPPYGNLEVYSDNPKDLSNMEFHTFIAVYKRIILKACKKLRSNRFACFVVGDFRDKKTGFYRDFVSETIRGFKDSGLELYNEAILITSVGSACLRVTKQFDAGRKFAKTHQNVLVFCKGDWKKATEFANGMVDFDQF
jgi:hypothetical protein